MKTLSTIVTIAIDAMGGANAPLSVVEAMTYICNTDLKVNFLVFGDEDIVPTLIANYGIPKNRYEFYHSYCNVSDETKPLEVLRNFTKSSMRQAINAVKNNKAQACVSSGNTGALMVMSKTVLGTLNHVKRPAIAGLYPTLSVMQNINKANDHSNNIDSNYQDSRTIVNFITDFIKNIIIKKIYKIYKIYKNKSLSTNEANDNNISNDEVNDKVLAYSSVKKSRQGKVIMLDMGANCECNENLLFQFGLMGSSLCKALLGIKNPRIGILNIGTEQFKGRSVDQKASAILMESGLNFIGFIEGHDIVKGVVDVVVTDGFSGNIVLKASEGAVSMFRALASKSFKKNLLTKLCGLIMKPYLASEFQIIDPSANNGAMFIGANGIVIKSHGNSTAEGVASAINIAIDLAREDINTHIVNDLKKLQESGIGLDMIDKVKIKSAKMLGLHHHTT